MINHNRRPTLDIGPERPRTLGISVRYLPRIVRVVFPTF